MPTYATVLDQIGDAALRIKQLVYELQPVTDRITAGDRDPAILEKNERIQSEILRLDELRKQLFEALRAALDTR